MPLFAGARDISLFEKLGKILPVHVIVGNHDIYMKKTNIFLKIRLNLYPKLIDH